MNITYMNYNEVIEYIVLVIGANLFESFSDLYLCCL